MSEDKLTNMSLLFIKHEHLKLSFDSVIDNFADVKSQKNYGVLFITLVGSESHKGFSFPSQKYTCVIKTY